MQFFTYSGSVNAGVTINFISYIADLIFSSSIKKRGLVEEAYICIPGADIGYVKSVN